MLDVPCSIFISFLFDQTGRLRPAAVLTYSANYFFAFDPAGKISLRGKP